MSYGGDTNRRTRQLHYGKSREFIVAQLPGSFHRVHLWRLFLGVFSALLRRRFYASCQNISKVLIEEGLRSVSITMGTDVTIDYMDRALHTYD